MVQCDPVATIDLSDFEVRKAEITKELMAAASDIGFFRVKGIRGCACLLSDFAIFCCCLAAKSLDDLQVMA